MNKIKILVDGHVLDGKPQGTCSYIAGLYGALSSDKQVEIYIATSKKSSIDTYFANNERIKWVELTSKNKYVRLAYELPKLEKEIKPDFSHYQYISPLFKNSRWINTIHDVLFMDFSDSFPLKYRLMNRILFKLSAKRSDILLTVSEYSKLRISHHFAIDKKLIKITPNAVDNILSFKPTPVEKIKSGSYFLYVSRIEPRKNQHLLAEAFLESKLDESKKLVFVGAKSIDYTEFDECAKNERVIHLTNLSGENIVWLYKNAIASIYPSKCEGFGIPPLEAAILGCDSYAASNTALAELSEFLDGSFDAENIDEIKRILEGCVVRCKVDSDKERQILKLKERFNWSVIASDFKRTLLESI